MKIKKATLKGFKRSYRRLTDKAFEGDMGYWFYDRLDDMAIIREVGSISEMMGIAEGMVEAIQDWDNEELLETARKWLARWKAAFEACKA